MNHSNRKEIITVLVDAAPRPSCGGWPGIRTARCPAMCAT